MSDAFAKAQPFPHVVLDDFLVRAGAEACAREFPNIGSGQWIHYTHVNERKYGQSKLAEFPPSIRDAITELNSPHFLRFMSRLTGIENLLADSSLMGGGLHQSARGGYLNVHADFSGHPHHAHWRRRINLLLYLNHDWEESYGGQLELWERDMSRCARRVLPIFNRAVIFQTDADSYHGHPEPMLCPEGQTRKSIALYYFTEEPEAFKPTSTRYQVRPQDGGKALWIKLDNLALRGYYKMKRTLGLGDNSAGRLLRLLDRRGGKRR